MKVRASVGILGVLLAALFGLGGCAAKKEGPGFFVPDVNEEWIGTWVNTTETLPSYGYQKIVNTNWGYYEIFAQSDDSNPAYIGCSTLVDKWQDRTGDIWYKEFDRGPTIPQGIFVLNRISKNGSVLEWVQSESAFPTEEDLTAKNATLGYGILYRE